MPSAEKHVTLKFSKSGLKARNEPLSALLELSNFLSVAMEVEPLLEGALSTVLKHFSLDSGRIYLMEPKEQCLVLAAHKERPWEPPSIHAFQRL